MQRAAAPAEISVWEVRNGNEIEKVECMKAEVEVGQLAELKWCSSGTALLAHSSTEEPSSGLPFPRLPPHFAVAMLCVRWASGEVVTSVSPELLADQVGDSGKPVIALSLGLP
eukprot:s613_g7.t1